MKYSNYRNDFDFKFDEFSTYTIGETLVVQESITLDNSLLFEETFPISDNYIKSVLISFDENKLNIEIDDYGFWGTTLKLRVLSSTNTLDITPTIETPTTIKYSFSLSELGLFDSKLQFQFYAYYTGSIALQSNEFIYKYNGEFIYKLETLGFGFDRYIYSSGLPFYLIDTETTYTDFFKRIDGGFRYDRNKRSRNADDFYNQSQIPTLIYAFPSKKKTLTLSGSNIAGIPDYECDKTSLIFSCDDVKIDDVSHSVNKEDIEEINDGLEYGMFIQNIIMQETAGVNFEKTDSDTNILNENGIPILNEDEINITI